MPIYEYKCRSCGQTAEVRHGFKETFEGSCEACGGQMARLFNPAGIVFKGSGFYINDSRKPAPSEGGPSAKSESAPAASSAPAKSESAA